MIKFEIFFRKKKRYLHIIKNPHEPLRWLNDPQKVILFDNFLKNIYERKTFFLIRCFEFIMIGVRLGLCRPFIYATETTFSTFY